VVVLGAAVSPATVVQRARSIADVHDETIRDRLAMWQSGLLMIRDHPWLGVGPGQVRAWYPFYRRPEAVRPSTGHLHSSPIQIAAERGLPALAVWIWLWVVFFREGGRILRRLGRDRRRERALVSASLSAVAAFLVSGLFQHTFGDGSVIMLVYALMALPFIVDRGCSMVEPTAGRTFAPRVASSCDHREHEDVDRAGLGP
jgi:O-antigen ligase